MAGFQTKVSSALRTPAEVGHPTHDGLEPRGPGRPQELQGGFRRVNLSLDDASVATAKCIHPNISAAVREALAYWARHNLKESDER